MLGSIQHERDATPKRPYRARTANELIADEAEEYQVRARVPMLCECSDESCESLFLIATEDYRKIRRDALHFTTSPGHAISGATTATGSQRGPA